MESNCRTKVLQICAGGPGVGGVERFLIEHYKRINDMGIQFDFVFCTQNSMKSVQNKPLFQHSEFYELGLAPGGFGIKQYIKLKTKIKQLLKKKDYGIVHINTGNISIHYTVLKALFESGVPVRISHSHSAPRCSNFLKNIIYHFARIRIRNYSTHCFACSKAAGERVFGRHHKFEILPNAIDCELFRFNREIRTELRNENKTMESTEVYGFVARLDEVKNPIFAIDVFNEIIKVNTNAELWMIGEGSLEQQVSKKIEELGLYRKVKCFGFRTDINKFMSAIDYLFMPSLHEGLSVVAVEAQAADLMIFASDSISFEHKLTDKVYFLSLEKGSSYWGKFIEKHKNSVRKDTSRILQEKGYEINSAAKKLGGFYQNIMSQSK